MHLDFNNAEEKRELIMENLKCRLCGSNLVNTFVDLGKSPLSNSYLVSQQLNETEAFYPLHVYVCDNCFLVQLPEIQTPEQIFSDYAYFSSYSESWLNHAKTYVEKMIETYKIDESCQVIEIASNDGYLLQYFKGKEIPVLGIEPAKNVAAVAQAAGIPTITRFFGVTTAKDLVAQGYQADLLLGNNVLAHVPDLNDFISGLKIALKPHGIITMEFPHLYCLMAENQFDTIYHEHFSYFSFLTVERAFSSHGLRIFDVEKLQTHGGSLRIHAVHTEDDTRKTTNRLAELRDLEITERFDRIETYTSFSSKVRVVKRSLLEFLIIAMNEGKKVAAYGAPAKGNTFLNYSGISTDFLDYTVDRSPHKQGLYLPGTHIPIFHPDKVEETKPDYLLILPWNLKEEIMEQMSHIRRWGGQFVVGIPEVMVLP